MVLNSLGGVLQRLDHFEEAAEALQKSYKLLVEQGDDRGQAMVLNSLGGLCQRIGHIDDSERYFAASVELGNKLGDRVHLANKAHTS